MNSVIRRGVNEEQATKLVRHFKGTGVIVRFIEFMAVPMVGHWEK